MRDIVTVDGVQLTRAQVERAMRELDAPWRPKPGEQSEHDGERYLCVHLDPATKAQMYRNRWPYSFNKHESHIVGFRLSNGLPNGFGPGCPLTKV